MSDYQEVTLTKDFHLSAIKLYIKYDYITARDLSDISRVVDDAYNCVTRNIVSHRFEYGGDGDIVFHKPNLLVSSVHTGNSITFEFANQVLPHLLDKAGTPVLVLPVWSGIFGFVAMCLKFGLDSWKTILDIMDRFEKNDEVGDASPPELEADLKALLALIDQIKSRHNIESLEVSGLPVRKESEEETESDAEKSNHSTSTSTENNVEKD